MAIQKITTPIIGDAAVTTDKINNDFVTSVTTNPEFQGTSHIKLPAGTTAQRPVSPAAGMLRYNTTTGFNEVYDGNNWSNFGAPPPSISTVTPTTYNGESGTSFTINGANFLSDATVFFITSGGTEAQAGSVSFISSVQLTATTPQDFTVADEPLDVKVVQSSGQITKLDVIDCGGVPAWNTASGTIATINDQYGSYSPITTVSASDPDSGATITYSLVSGTLPSGTSLNTSTGAISGDPTNVASQTTSNFTLAATDNAGNATQRAFSIIVNPYPDGSTSTRATSLLSNLSSISAPDGIYYFTSADYYGGQPFQARYAYYNNKGWIEVFSSVNTSAFAPWDNWLATTNGGYNNALSSSFYYMKIHNTVNGGIDYNATSSAILLGPSFNAVDIAFTTKSSRSANGVAASGANENNAYPLVGTLDVSGAEASLIVNRLCAYFTGQIPGFHAAGSAEPNRDFTGGWNKLGNTHEIVLGKRSGAQSTSEWHIVDGDAADGLTFYPNYGYRTDGSVAANAGNWTSSQNAKSFSVSTSNVMSIWVSQS